MPQGRLETILKSGGRVKVVGGRRRMSPWMIRTFGNAPTVSSKTGRNRLSSSTATPRPARAASSRVSVPNHGPTSRTVSVFFKSALSATDISGPLSIKKCWPRRRFSTIPCWLANSRISDGFVRSISRPQARQIKQRIQTSQDEHLRPAGIKKGDDDQTEDGRRKFPRDHGHLQKKCPLGHRVGSGPLIVQGDHGNAKGVPGAPVESIETQHSQRTRDRRPHEPGQRRKKRPHSEHPVPAAVVGQPADGHGHDRGSHGCRRDNGSHVKKLANHDKDENWPDRLRDQFLAEAHETKKPRPVFLLEKPLPGVEIRKLPRLKNLGSEQERDGRCQDQNRYDDEQHRKSEKKKDGTADHRP